MSVLQPCPLWDYRSHNPLVGDEKSYLHHSFGLKAFNFPQGFFKPAFQWRDLLELGRITTIIKNRVLAPKQLLMSKFPAFPILRPLRDCSSHWGKYSVSRTDTGKREADKVKESSVLLRPEAWLKLSCCQAVSCQRSISIQKSILKRVHSHVVDSGISIQNQWQNEECIYAHIHTLTHNGNSYNNSP